MAVKLNSTGGGSVTLDSPSTASNYTVTLPSAAGTVATASGTTFSNSSITAANSNTVEATSGPTSSQLAGNRNKIINGAMMIDQRNAGASVTQTATFLYSVDRFGIAGSVASKFTAQQSSTAPVGFTNSLLCTSSSAYSVGSSDSFSIQQRIEGLNCFDLAWGTANAATVTLSFWVRSSLTGTFGGSLRNGAADRSYPFSFVVNASNTWEQKTISISGDTSGTWLVTNGGGIILSFSLGAGSTVSGTAGAWSAGNYVSATGAVSVVGTSGATYHVAGVQLEKGATATPFENRLYGTELALCQRYCLVYGGLSGVSNEQICMGQASSATIALMVLNPPVQMRTTPSLSVVSASGFFINDTSVQNATSALVMGGQASSLCLFTSATTSGLTQGRVVRLMANTTSDKAIFSAEL